MNLSRSIWNDTEVVSCSADGLDWNVRMSPSSFCSGLLQANCKPSNFQVFSSYMTSNYSNSTLVGAATVQPLMLFQLMPVDKE